MMKYTETYYIAQASIEELSFMIKLNSCI